MEPIGAISEGEWSSLSEMYTNEEADFMAQLLGNCSAGNPNGNIEDDAVAAAGGASLGSLSSGFWPSLDYHSSSSMANCVNENSSSYYAFDIIGNNNTNNNTGSHYFSQGMSSNSTAIYSNIIFPRITSTHEGYYSNNDNDNSNSCMAPLMDFCMGDGTDTSSYLIEEGDDCSNRETGNGDCEDRNRPSGEEQVQDLELRSESKMKASEEAGNNIEDKVTIPSQSFKKRSRSTGDLLTKNKRNVKPRKNGKISGISMSNNNGEDDNNGVGVNKQTTSSCCSEDDYMNPIQEITNEGETSSLSTKGKAVANHNGKTRASRGSATDPQSLYARKRRERINERLKILQNLVPNGTKVDISTMLEEAVEYVKFLQLQIKLLSSDDLWMYAPIAYNGMNIGLDLKLTPPR